MEQPFILSIDNAIAMVIKGTPQAKVGVNQRSKLQPKKYPEQTIRGLKGGESRIEKGSYKQAFNFGRLLNQGCAASSCAAREKRVSSSPNRPAK